MKDRGMIMIIYLKSSPDIGSPTQLSSLCLRVADHSLPVAMADCCYCPDPCWPHKIVQYNTLTKLYSTIPWWPKWWSWGRSPRCGGHGWTVAWALIFAHSAIISSSQLVPLVGNRVCSNLDTANQNCAAAESLLRLQVDSRVQGRPRW